MLLYSLHLIQKFDGSASSLELHPPLSLSQVAMSIQIAPGSCRSWQTSLSFSSNNFTTSCCFISAIKHCSIRSACQQAVVNAVQFHSAFLREYYKNNRGLLATCTAYFTLESRLHSSTEFVYQVLIHRSFDDIRDIRGLRLACTSRTLQPICPCQTYTRKQTCLRLTEHKRRHLLFFS